VTITDRGRPVARMTPIAGSPLQALIDAGHARPATRTLRDLPPPAPGPSLVAPHAGCPAPRRRPAAGRRARSGRHLRRAAGRGGGGAPL